MRAPSSDVLPRHRVSPLAVCAVGLAILLAGLIVDTEVIARWRRDHLALRRAVGSPRQRQPRRTAPGATRRSGARGSRRGRSPSGRARPRSASANPGLIFLGDMPFTSPSSLDRTLAGAGGARANRSRPGGVCPVDERRAKYGRRRRRVVGRQALYVDPPYSRPAPCVGPSSRRGTSCERERPRRRRRRRGRLSPRRRAGRVLPRLGVDRRRAGRAGPRRRFAPPSAARRIDARGCRR